MGRKPSVPDSDGAHWNDVRNVSQDVGKAIIEAFHKIETANLRSFMVSLVTHLGLIRIVYGQTFERHAGAFQH